MPDTPRVSVVIPAWNREREIRASVESVLRQTLSDLEVIVVDDASTDGTAAAVEAIGDPRVRLVRHEANRGGSAARNTGIGAARADWVAFQDSDDEWLPAKLERQFAAMARLGPETVGAYCGMIVLGRPEGDRPDPSELRYVPRPRFGVPVEGDLTFSLLRSGSLISTQTFLGRRAALEAAGGFDEALKALQDWDCFIRVAAQGPIAFEPEPLVIQRFSPNSLTKSSRNRALALTRVLEKNEAAFADMPEVLAAHCLSAAGGLRRAGDRKGARRWLAKARRLTPWSARLWARAALLGVDALRHAIGRREA